MPSALNERRSLIPMQSPPQSASAPLAGFVVTAAAAAAAEGAAVGASKSSCSPAEMKGAPFSLRLLPATVWGGERRPISALFSALPPSSARELGCQESARPPVRTLEWLGGLGAPPFLTQLYWVLRIGWRPGRGASILATN